MTTTQQSYAATDAAKMSATKAMLRIRASWTTTGAFCLLALAFFLGTEGSRRDPNFDLIWSDEFRPCDDTGAGCHNGLKTSNWNFEEGDGGQYGTSLIGWGNDEVQCYTNRSENVRVLPQAGGARGVLVLEAQFEREPYQCGSPTSDRPATTTWWTSARLTSRGKAAFAPEETPVKFEARVKVPNEWGAWSAFWLLPDTPRTDCLACGDYGNGWCSSGEIDILETVNRNPNIRSTLHWGGLKDQSWLNCQQSTVDHPVNVSTADYWTRVSTVWGPSSISFFVNDTLTHTVLRAQWYTGAVDKAVNPVAPFDRPFHMLFNLAVGGRLVTPETQGLLITDSRRAPYRMMVDWVRVYRQREAAPAARRLMRG